MSSTTHRPPPTLGRCPVCRTVIASLDVRIDEPGDGPPALRADCPGCRQSVTPE